MPKRRSDDTRRRDPAATRRKLLTAARREFASRGLAGARVDDIAARAGVNKQLVYHYFGDKDALYLAVLEWVTRKFLPRSASSTVTGCHPERPSRSRTRSPSIILQPNRTSSCFLTAKI